jgi:hypothetical protein
VIANDEVTQQIQERERFVTTSATSSPPSYRAQLYGVLADLTDEDGTLNELDDLDGTLFNFDDAEDN